MSTSFACQVRRLEGKTLIQGASNHTPLPSSKTSPSSVDMADAHLATPPSSRDEGEDPFVTAATHERLYPRLDLARDGGRVPVGVVLKMGSVVARVSQRGQSENGGVVSSASGTATDQSDSFSSGDFVTAQQSQSKLLQLLTSESATGSDSATPQDTGGVALDSLSPPDGKSGAPKDKRSGKDASERPRSVTFVGCHHSGSGGSRGKKSPLATSSSRAPRPPSLASQDHAHRSERTSRGVVKEELPARDREEEEEDPRPSAPPPLMDMTHHQSEIRKVNSYTGLGKRRSAFSQIPPPLTSSKKQAPSSAGPDPQGSAGVAPGLGRTSVPTSHAHLVDVAAAAEDSTMPTSVSALLSQRRGSLPSQRQFSPKLTGLSALPQGGVVIIPGATPPRGVVLASTTGKPRGASLDAGRSEPSPKKEGKSISPARRAVSWLEHLKSKLPLQ